MKIKFWDMLASLVMLAGLALATIFINIFVNPYSFLNPFPPPTPIAALEVPTLTPSQPSLPEVWTATPEATKGTPTVTTTRATETVTVTGTRIILPSTTPTGTRTKTVTPTKSNTPNKTLTQFYSELTATSTPTQTEEVAPTAAPTATQEPCSYTAGYCDDANPRISYTGYWNFFYGSGPYNYTTHYSSVAGSTFSLVFTGNRISYVYAGYTNRGHAEISIDGTPVTTINLYSATLQWQQMWTSGDLGYATHTISVRVVDGVVDLDTFIIYPSGGTSSTTTITSDLPDPSDVGSSYAVNVTVTGTGGTPTGNVTVSDGTGGSCVFTLAGGSGSCNLTSTSAGAKTLTATYGGDSTFNSSSGTTSHTVVNSAPVITEGASTSVTMSEDNAPTAFSLTLNATDANVTDTLTWSISSAASHGTASASGTGTSKVIGYTPNTNYNGSDSFVVQVSDGSATDTITVNVTITAVDDGPPVITEGASTAVTMSEDGAPTAFSLTLHATDPDPEDTITWNINTAASDGTATAAGTGTSQVVGYTPNANYNGTDWFNVQASDGTGSDVITVNVTITAVNDGAPVITEGATASVTMDEDETPSAFSLTLNATDPDPEDTITWSISSGASHGTATASGTGTPKAIGYTPDGDYNGSDSFVVQVTDGTASATITVTVTINAINDAPTAIGLSNNHVASGSPGGTSVGTLSTTDVDSGDSHTYSFTCTVPGGDEASFAISGTDLQTAGALVDGAYAICIRTTDNGVGTLSHDENFSIFIP